MTIDERKRAVAILFAEVRADASEMTELLPREVRRRRLSGDAREESAPRNGAFRAEDGRPPVARTSETLQVRGGGLDVGAPGGVIRCGNRPGAAAVLEP